MFERNRKRYARHFDIVVRTDCHDQVGNKSKNIQAAFNLMEKKEGDSTLKKKESSFFRLTLCFRGNRAWKFIQGGH